MKSRIMGNLKGKTLFITGASRGIGKAIGLRAARDGANVVIAAKTVETHPQLPGTIHSAAEEMEAAGKQGKMHPHSEAQEKLKKEGDYQRYLLLHHREQAKP